MANWHFVSKSELYLQTGTRPAAVLPNSAHSPHKLGQKLSVLGGRKRFHELDQKFFWMNLHIKRHNLKNQSSILQEFEQG